MAKPDIYTREKNAFADIAQSDVKPPMSLNQFILNVSEKKILTVNWLMIIYAPEVDQNV